MEIGPLDQLRLFAFTTCIGDSRRPVEQLCIPAGDDKVVAHDSWTIGYIGLSSRLLSKLSHKVVKYEG